MGRIKSEVQKNVTRKARIELLSQQLGYTVEYDSSRIRINTGDEIITRVGFLKAIGFLEYRMTKQKKLQEVR